MDEYEIKVLEKAVPEGKVYYQREYEPEQVRIKVGSFELDFLERYSGRVLVDGKELHGVQRVVVEVSATEMPQVRVEFIPGLGEKPTAYSPDHVCYGVELTEGGDD